MLAVLRLNCDKLASNKIQNEWMNQLSIISTFNDLFWFVPITLWSNKFKVLWGQCATLLNPHAKSLWSHKSIFKYLLESLSAFISAISVSGRPAAKQDSGIIHYVHYILSLCFAAYLSIVFGFISSPFSKFLNSINFVTFHCVIPTVIKVLSGVCLCWLLSLCHT